MKYDAWKIPDIIAAPQKLLAAGYSPLLAALLDVKGLHTPEAAREYLQSGPETLSDAMAMADMPAAVERVRRAIEAKEHVAVYGDYDVDGITATAILTDWLRSKGLEIEMYIPNRIGEGYGLNVAAIETLHKKGVQLLITVDCGVSALQEAEAAAALGMDMIITDHHECQPELPKCIAVVDPKRQDCPGSKNLAGVGVAFKLICAVEGESASVLYRWGDFVAVGTVADVMPMIGENRYIIQYGLDRLSREPRPGMAALLAECGAIKRPVHAAAIGFSVAPRLNAAGRLGHAVLAVELLLCQDKERCSALAKELCALNRERQRLEQETWQEALTMLEEAPPQGPIVLAKEGWHQGVVGIAASRLTDAYSLPAVMICLDGDEGKGSCRSYGGFNLFEALCACSDTLEGFGGHAMAAGLNIRKDMVPAFREALREYYEAHPPAGENVLNIDLCIDDGRMLEIDCVDDLEKLEPCGSGNPRPECCFTGAVLESITPFSNGKHLRLRLRKFGRSFNCVFFSQTEEALGVRIGDVVDAAFFPQINEFRDRRSVQLLMTDLRKTPYLSQCRAILRGDTPPNAYNSELLLPLRADFVFIWKNLEQLGGALSGELDQVLHQLTGNRFPVLTSVCLMVFAQAGLLELQLQPDDRLELRVCPSSDKKDLEATPLMRYLRQL